MSDGQSRPPRWRGHWGRAALGREPQLKPRRPHSPNPVAWGSCCSCLPDTPCRPPRAPWPLGPPLRCPRGLTHPAWHSHWPRHFPGSLGHPVLRRGGCAASEATGRLLRARSPSQARRPTDSSGKAAFSPRRLLCREGCSRVAESEPQQGGQVSTRATSPLLRCGLPAAGRGVSLDALTVLGLSCRHCEVNVALPPRSVHAAVTLLVHSSLPRRAGQPAHLSVPRAPAHQPHHGEGACPGLWHGLPRLPRALATADPDPLGLVPSPPRPTCPGRHSPLAQ